MSPPTARPTPDQVQEAYAEGTRATLFGLVISAALALLKVGAGIIGNSYALIADGAESVLDLFSSLLVWSGLRMSTHPQTPEFPYGRGKFESLSTVLVASILVVASAGIAAGAVHGILSPHEPPERFTLLVLVVVVIAKEFVSRKLLSKGSEVGSLALEADAWHHRSDALTSAAAFVGISIAILGGGAWASADEWAALAACGVISWNGVRLFRGGVRAVLDAAAPSEVYDRIRELSAEVPGVEGIDQVRVRRSGLVFLVDIHVEVDGTLTVHEGHAIGHEVKDRLTGSELPILDALVHVEPRRAHPPST